MLVRKPFGISQAQWNRDVWLPKSMCLLGCEGERLHVPAYCISSDFPTRLGIRMRLTPGDIITKPVCSHLLYGLVLIMILPRYPNMVGWPHRRPSYIGNGKWWGSGMASVLVQQRSWTGSCFWLCWTLSSVAYQCWLSSFVYYTYYGHRQPPPKFTLWVISIRIRNIPVSWMHLLQLEGGRFTTTFAGVFYYEDDFTCILQSTLFFRPCITIVSVHLWH